MEIDCEGTEAVELVLDVDKEAVGLKSELFLDMVNGAVENVLGESGGESPKISVSKSSGTFSNSISSIWST